ncbi:4-(cytidine 5'-diphospho)-2-C-methyl-D-erythritol kinase [Streptomyces marincola]|uniref:4-(cytidine 5'-diphospho)-2-C-methyl-D-erythritol kinase n=1 Tax=Streptomyces marincola TaxID=2878388 RepID=UPI001CF37B29|nr:4-(cytidine 5'-diphospho)-2-C-methyl-D-erythritol kinase [Streptomyces marincola]UCM88538.1 4-(cytidine 5'-diphospho)-2-C-methyl-D-erythritol kinase [Streptomyces marincola]
MSQPPRPAPGRSVTVRVPAKVNVQLSVGPRRPDGFHDLANVFLAVGIHDRVTATPAPDGRGPGISCSGPGSEHVPLDGRNLAVRAAELLAAHHGFAPDVHLHIDKDIPVAGGMAGGSADAAGALLACDTLWGTRTPRADLLELCARLGSDVPFSLVGGAALGEGRGERLTELPVGGTFHWVFAPADGGLGTPEVYRECDRLRGAAAVPEPAADPALLAALRAGDTAGLAAALANDLQPAALSLRPGLAATLAAGLAAGAPAGLVSGSGPTCAFLAPDAEAAAGIAAALVANGVSLRARATAGPVPGATTIESHA